MDDNSAWADEVLRRVRASAGPRPSNEARVLAGLERRLGIVDPLRVSEGDAAELGPAQGPAASLASRSPIGGAALAGRALSIARLARPLGLGAAFGLATGAVGYWWGSRAQASRVDSAVPALSMPAEAAQPPLLVPAPRQLALAEVGLEPASSAAAPSPGPRAEPASTRPRSKHAAPGRAAPAARHARQLANSDDAKKAPSSLEKVARTGGALTLREAIQQLQRAQTALRRGEALAALELVSQLDQSNPGPMLREERLVTRALALCEMGDLSSAREVLHELGDEEAQSIYRARVEAGCGLAGKDVDK